MTEDDRNEFLSGLGKCKSLDERKPLPMTFMTKWLKNMGINFNGMVLSMN